MILNWYPEAEVDFLCAAKYYGQQDGNLESRFALLVETTTERILLHPPIRPCFYGDCLRIKAEKFPSFIIYRLKGELIQIIAVMHTSRRPGYWKGRL